MDLTHFQQHTFAYLALFIGSGMFVLYRAFYSWIIVVVSLLANIILIKLNSSLTFDEIMVNGGFLTFAVAIFSVFLIRARFNLTKKEIISRLALKATNEELSVKNEVIEEKTKEIVDSINYAKRIQLALITPEEVLKKVVPNSFVFFQPKDIVSGDFYWFAELSTTKEGTDNEHLVVFCVADCTGHGVPGAFMSLIGMKILNQSIKQKDVNSPAEALDFLNAQVYDTMNKHASEDNIVRDGMDAVLFAINFNRLTLNFAGANNPLFIIRDKEVIELKADKQPIGAYEAQQSFTNYRFDLQKGDVIYATTDGYIDQFGGEDGKKLKSKKFKEKLLECVDLPIEQQKEYLSRFFNSWKGSLEQLDDVCVMGIKI
jgi:serine phosphatase RsbU (regulator of sigma subunit)